MTLTASVIIVWLVIGLVIGALARLLVPGRQHIGIIMTILIGIMEKSCIESSISQPAPASSLLSSLHAEDKIQVSVEDFETS